jgi:hypothetical protein
VPRVKYAMDHCPKNSFSMSYASRKVIFPGALPINCDNQGALSHITTGIIKACTKHIDVCYHNSRDLHARKLVDYSYVHTNENVADILTKALSKDKHEKFTKVMGLW